MSSCKISWRKNVSEKGKKIILTQFTTFSNQARRRENLFREDTLNMNLRLSSYLAFQKLCYLNDVN